jgi:hypothetical protein
VTSDAHGAELVDLELVAADADAALLEEDRPGLVSLTAIGDREEHGAEDDESDEGPGDVDGALGDAAEAEGGVLAVGEDGHALELAELHALGHVAGLMSGT